MEKWHLELGLKESRQIWSVEGRRGRLSQSERKPVVRAGSSFLAAPPILGSAMESQERFSSLVLLNRQRGSLGSMPPTPSPIFPPSLCWFFLVGILLFLLGQRFSESGSGTSSINITWEFAHSRAQPEPVTSACWGWPSTLFNRLPREFRCILKSEGQCRGDSQPCIFPFQHGSLRSPLPQKAGLMLGRAMKHVGKSDCNQDTRSLDLKLKKGAMTTS